MWDLGYWGLGLRVHVLILSVPVRVPSELYRRSVGSRV